jgi:hypothetical protein
MIFFCKIPFLKSIITLNLTLELLLIGLLIVYIGYLHYLLAKKKIRIKELEGWMKNIYSDYDSSSHKKFNQEAEYSQEKNEDHRDMILKKHILDFIFENEKGRKIFLHYTKEEEDAKKILKEGFKFVDSFYKTAEEVRSDETDLIYKHNRQKSYGNYVIVISIDKDIYNYYLKETDKTPSYEIVVEQLLTEKPPYLNDDSEMIYTLHHKFVKGYFNYIEGNIIENQYFNPTYNSYQFYENLKKLTFGD